MTWIIRLLRRQDTEDLDRRVSEAKALRDEAAAVRSEAERLGSRNRAHMQANHFGDRIEAAFKAGKGRHA